VHNKSNRRGWEILDASVNCMVAIDVLHNAPQQDTYRDRTEIFSYGFTKEREVIDVPVSKQTYHKLNIEASTHPYFKLVWHCRHILNENSSLLSKEVKDEMKVHGGWPPERNTYLGVRLALEKFNTMVRLSKVVFLGVILAPNFALNDKASHRYGCVNIYVCSILRFTCSRLFFHLWDLICLCSLDCDYERHQ